MDELAKKSVLGFGDLRGYYDFDSFSGELPASHSQKSSSILSKNILLAHENNHWNQQISTTFGNFSSVLRWNILGSTSVLWRSLNDELKADIVDGVESSPFTLNKKYCLEEGHFLKDNSLEQKQYLTKCLKLIRHFKNCDKALSSTEWLKWDDLRKEYLVSLIKTFDKLELHRGKQATRSRYQLSAINVILETDYIFPSSDMDIYLNEQLWDVPLILEASCVAQEFYLAKQWKWKMRSWSKDRFKTISSSPYSGPLKQVLSVLGLKWNQKNLINCAGLITSIVEVALNPKLPPRFLIDLDDIRLSEIHPSLRFLKLVKSLNSSNLRIKNYNKFASIVYSDQQNSLMSYIENCKNIASVADVSFEHRLSENFIRGREKYVNAASALRSSLLASTREETRKYFREFSEHYPRESHFLLDSGYNRIFQKGYCLQNSIMLYPKIVADGHKLRQNITETIKQDFATFTSQGLTSSALEFSIGKHRKIANDFIGEKRGLFTAGIKINLALYLLLFHSAGKIKATNIPGVQETGINIQSIRDILINYRSGHHTW